VRGKLATRVVRQAVNTIAGYFDFRNILERAHFEKFVSLCLHQLLVRHKSIHVANPVSCTVHRLRTLGTYAPVQTELRKTAVNDSRLRTSHRFVDECRSVYLRKLLHINMDTFLCV
jgi:hypothetical protein